MNVVNVDDSEDLTNLLEKLVFLSGQSKEAILNEWNSILQEKNRLIESVENTSDINEFEVTFKEQESQFSFEVFWIEQVFDAVAKLRKADNDVKKAEARLQQLSYLKTLRQANELYRQLGLDSEDIGEKQIRETGHIEEAWALLGQFDDLVIRVGITNLRKFLRRYKRQKFFQKFQRFGLRIFWGLLVITLGVNAVTSFIPIWYIVLVITIIGWFLQEYYFQPWLNKKLFEKHRMDLKQAIKELYTIKIRAHSTLLAATPYFKDSDIAKRLLNDESGEKRPIATNVEDSGRFEAMM